MRVLAVFSILCCSVFAGDEDDVRAVVAKYVEAREHRDPQATAALFSNDADQLVSSGEWRHGRDAVVRGTMASSESSGGKRTITVESVRFVAPEVALVDGRYELTGLAGGVTRKMWTSLTIVRTADGWRIAAIRNMLPAPAVAHALLRAAPALMPALVPGNQAQQAPR